MLSTLASSMTAVICIFLIPNPTGTNLAAAHQYRSVRHGSSLTGLWIAVQAGQGHLCTRHNMPHAMQTCTSDADLIRMHSADDQQCA